MREMIEHYATCLRIGILLIIFLCIYNVYIVYIYTTDVMKFNFGFQFRRCRRSQVPSVSHLCLEKIVLFLNFAKNNLLQNIHIFFL